MTIKLNSPVLKRKKTKNGKIGHNHRRACCNCHSRFAFVHNANLVNNINTAIDSKNYSKAEQLIDGYQEANPTRTDVYELYADLYLAENNPEKAIEKLEEGVRRVSSSGKKDLQNKIDAIKQEYNLE